MDCLKNLIDVQNWDKTAMNVKKQMKIHNKRLTHTLPQAPFSKRNNEQIMENMRILEKT